MKFTVDRDFIVEVLHKPRLGMAWIVRTRKRRFLFFMGTVSSDWFLDEQQAIRYARNLVSDLSASRPDNRR